MQNGLVELETTFAGCGLEFRHYPDATISFMRWIPQ
jgi:hypothetical protein